jgi:hypothetical protein
MGDLTRTKFLHDTYFNGERRWRKYEEREELYFCTIPTGGGAVEIGGERGWSLFGGGARNCFPHVNKTNDKANLSGS